MYKEGLVTQDTDEDLKGTLNKAVTIVDQLRGTYWPLEFFSQLGEEMSRVCKTIVSN